MAVNLKSQLFPPISNKQVKLVIVITIPLLIIDTIINNVPEYILNIATKSANLIGKGFYGVDVKETNNKAYVIEINDNPSIDAGVEDVVLKDDLYNTIMQYFLKGMQNEIN